MAAPLASFALVAALAHLTVRYAFTAPELRVDPLRFSSAITGSCSTVMFLLYSSLIREAFAGFTCRADLIGGVRRLVLDLSVDCDSASHRTLQTIALAAICVYVLGAPLCVYLVLLRQRESLKKEWLLRKFGFLKSRLSGPALWLGAARHLRPQGAARGGRNAGG